MARYGVGSFLFGLSVQRCMGPRQYSCEVSLSFCGGCLVIYLLLKNYFMWAFHRRAEGMVMPRYFACETISSICP